MASLDEIVRNIVFHLQQNRPLLPMYVVNLPPLKLTCRAFHLLIYSSPLSCRYLHLICAALFPIYTGAHASLSRPSSAAKPLTKPDKDELDDEDEEETVQKMEGLTPQDAIMFPITAAVVLAGLYWAIKSYGADVINTFLGLYFSLIGTYSVGKLINDSWTTISTFVYPAYYRDDGRIWRVSSEHRKAECLDDGEGPALRSSPLAGVLGRIPIPEPLLALAWSLRIFFKEKFQVTGYAKVLFLGNPPVISLC
jgi:minor histocompatibility antigen H13